MKGDVSLWKPIREGSIFTGYSLICFTLMLGHLLLSFCGRFGVWANRTAIMIGIGPMYDPTWSGGRNFLHDAFQTAKDPASSYGFERTGAAAFACRPAARCVELVKPFPHQGRGIENRICQGKSMKGIVSEKTLKDYLRQKNQPVPFVMDWGFVNSLGIVRGLGRFGLQSVVLHPQRNGLALASQHTIGSLCPNSTTQPEALVDFLLEIGRELRQKGVLLLTDDNLSGCPLAARDSLNAFFTAHFQTMRS